MSIGNNINWHEQNEKGDGRTFSIGQLAEEFGVTHRTIRFYEDEGLIAPARRGTTRIYSHGDRGRLALILRGKRFGFSLEEIRQLLDLYHMGDQQQTQIAAAYEIARARLADLESRREELNEAIEDLKDQLKWGEKMISSMNQPRRAAE